MKCLKYLWLTLGLTLMSGLVTASCQAQEKRIYIALDDHTDYMWTADEATYRQVFLDTLDYYISRAEATAGEASAYQSRFNADGTFWFKTYLENRSSSQVQRLVSQIKSGHITLPLAPLVLVYGGSPTEAILRGMYYAGSLERRYGISFPLGVAQENQTLPYGLGALFAGAGARYSYRGICNCLTLVPNAWDREHDIYRWVGPDGSTLLMKWNSMLTGNNQSMGGYAEARDPGGVVEYVDNNAAFIARYPYSVIGAFGYGWDDLQSLTEVFEQTAKAKTSSSRKVFVSNQQDFFEDFESTYDIDSLPAVSVTFGNEWELYAASMAEVSASVRRSVEKLRSAEAMATLVYLEDPDFMTSRQADREEAMMDMGLYYEHNWVGGGMVSTDARAAWQRKIAGQVTSYVDALYSDALTRLGGLIAGQSTYHRFFVFNPLSWSRNDFADYPWSGSNTVFVIDLTTGREVPSQIITLDGERKVRILASKVPAVGYKVFEIREGTGTTYSDAATIQDNVIDNDYYRITVSERGAITSILDKAHSNQELVRTIDGRAMNDLGSGTGRLEAENVGPVSVTLKASADSPLKHTTRITVYRESDRIDIRNDITQGFSSTYTWGYGFNLDAPDVHHEEVGAVIRARLSTDGGQYSPRNARYDWLTLNHFADISDGAGARGVTLSSADCAFFRLGSSSVSTLDTSTPMLSPLVGGQVDGTYLGIPNQGGDTYFLQRFALRVHGAYQMAAAMKFALEHQNPLVAGTVSGGSVYPDTSYSLLTLSNPSVLLWTLKPADDGGGIVARVWNMSDSSAPFTVTATEPVAQAQTATHLETATGTAALTDGKLTATARAQQLMTFLLSSDQAVGDDDTPGDDDTTGDDDVTGDDDASEKGDGGHTGCGASGGTSIATGGATIALGSGNGGSSGERDGSSPLAPRHGWILAFGLGAIWMIRRQKRR